MNVLLFINSIFILVTTIILTIMITRKIDKNNVVKNGFYKIINSVNDVKASSNIKQYSFSFAQKIRIIDKFELYLIGNSNIQRYIPFFNFTWLVVSCLVIFIVLLIPVYRVLYSIPSSVIICAVFSLIPMFFLELLGRYNSDKIRKNLSRFISVLSRWCEVREDIFFAFEKSIDSGIGEPLRTNIEELVLQVKHGIDPIEALDMLELKVRNPQFKIFIINIKQNFKARGDIIKLLSNLEDQFYAIDEEYSRLKISTLIDRMIIYISMFCVLLIGYYILKTNQSIHNFYMGTFTGKMIMSVFCVMFAIGVYLTIKITRFDY